jgi:hypothetical protein
MPAKRRLTRVAAPWPWEVACLEVLEHLTLVLVQQPAATHQQSLADLPKNRNAAQRECDVLGGVMHDAARAGCNNNVAASTQTYPTCSAMLITGAPIRSAIIAPRADKTAC